MTMGDQWEEEYNHTSGPHLHCTMTWSTTTEQFSALKLNSADTAVDDADTTAETLVEYVTKSTAVSSTVPKFVPLMYTTSFPTVFALSDPGPVTLTMAGAS